MNNRYLLVSVGIAALVFGIWFAGDKQKLFDPQQLHATWLKKPRPVTEFNLQGPSNAAVTHKSLKNQWSLLFFGFTRCPNMCPVTLNEVALAYDKLAPALGEKLPKMYMISVDLDNDKTSEVQTYVNKFHPAFIGLTGEKPMVDKLAKQFGIAYMKVPNDIQHSGTLLLINPKAELVAYFTYPHRAADLAEDLQKIL